MRDRMQRNTEMDALTQHNDLLDNHDKYDRYVRTYHWVYVFHDKNSAILSIRDERVSIYFQTGVFGCLS